VNSVGVSGGRLDIVGRRSLSNSSFASVADASPARGDSGHATAMLLIKLRRILA
jgi:hypothetical protein